MAAPAVVAPITLDAFYAMHDLPDLAELSDGEVVLTPPGSSDHGYLASALYDALRDHVVARHLGRCFTDGFGYELPIPGRPNTFRIPDASFVRAERIPHPRPRHRAFALAPDVAVEIRSPSDTRGVLPGKTRDYLDAGTTLVWVIDPDARTVEVHTPDAPVRVLHEHDTLDGGAALPGFTLPLATVFSVLDE